ncbi:hypothetical protein Taro_018631 [Colocasia esculenta]|uniref:Uncharacterized protein n=1 Tax=Colocasia esculenta TaxID=4460 RepID=A0A843UR94_COLES|nr:hypothetical protein [Colocasia esculenta]
MSTDAAVVIRLKSTESTCRQILRDLSTDVADRNARVLCFGKTVSACRQMDIAFTLRNRQTKFEMADRGDWGGGGDDPEENTQRIIERIWESLTDI